MDESTILAAERTAMAADRSLMAWVRTSLALISFGFTIYKFLQYAREDLIHASASTITVSSPKVVGLFLIGLGTLALILGTADHVMTIRDLQKRYGVKRARFSIFVATLVVLLGLVLFFSITFK